MFRVKAGDIIINAPDTQSKDVITGTITKTVNCIDKFSFRISPKNAGYNALEAMKTHIDVEDILHNDKNTFHGRVLTVTPCMASDGTIYKDVVCEGELGYLCDSAQPAINRSYPITNFISALLAEHNQQCPTKQILKGQIFDTTASNHQIELEPCSTLQALQTALLNDEMIGGEIRLRYANGQRYLDYTTLTFSQGSTTEIELAVNMQAATQQIDPTSIVTRLYPYGAKIGDTNVRVTITGGYIEDPTLVAEYGVISRAMIWDDCTTEAELKSTAMTWLVNQKPVKRQYSVTAADLSVINTNYTAFKVGTQYRVKNPLIGLDDVLRCIGVEICIEDRVKTRLTFGDKFDTATSQAAEREIRYNKKLVQIEKNASPLIKAIVDNQTALITGAEGGYIYYSLNNAGKPQDVYFLNSPDITTATSAIRINKNGIGFWTGSAGGASAGPYTSAWTIDGVFNTSYIVSQVLTGLQINNGNGTFTVDNSGNVIANSLTSNNATITGGSINITTASETANIIKLNSGAYHSVIAPQGIEFVNDTHSGKVDVQSGGIWAFWNNENKFFVNAQTGYISTGGGGYTVFEVNTNGWEVNLYYTNSAQKSIVLDGGSGKIIMYDDTGEKSLEFEANSRHVAMYDRDGSTVKIEFDVPTGTIYCSQVLQR